MTSKDGYKAAVVFLIKDDALQNSILALIDMVDDDARAEGFDEGMKRAAYVQSETMKQLYPTTVEVGGVHTR